MSLSVGAAAPDFELAGIDGATGAESTYRLADFAGQPLVLVFYPADHSPVCTRQLLEYTAGVGEFARLGAQVLAISPQSIDEHRSFTREHGGFGFPLLSDPDKAMGEAYGIVGLLGLYRRSVFVIDGGGAIGYIHRYVGPGLSFVPAAALVDALTRVTT